ncbi:hypothetical protein CD155_03705 [Staphylococcus caprae]|nr:hypothetical protein CD155_03705 [Staphylococcus caprae]SUL89883.1 Uncharacterised protein [Staphylococcus caprae]
MFAYVVGRIIGEVLSLLFRITIVILCLLIRCTVFIVRKVSQRLEDAIIYCIENISKEVKSRRQDGSINTDIHGVKKE